MFLSFTPLEDDWVLSRWILDTSTSIFSLGPESPCAGSKNCFTYADPVVAWLPSPLINHCTWQKRDFVKRRFFPLDFWKLLFLCRLVCSFPRREREECLFSRGADSSYILTRVRLKFFCRKSSAEKTNTNFVSKTHFFLISSSLSRARCAHMRAHIISLFFCVRARTRARKSHALLSSINLYRW